MNRASRFYVVRLMNSALMNVKDLSLFPNSDQFGTCSYNAKSILLCETLVMEAQVHFSSSRFTSRNRNYSLFHGLRFVFYTLFTITFVHFDLRFIDNFDFLVFENECISQNLGSSRFFSRSQKEVKFVDKI